MHCRMPWGSSQSRRASQTLGQLLINLKVHSSSFLSRSLMRHKLCLNLCRYCTLIRVFVPKPKSFFPKYLHMICSLNMWHILIMFCLVDIFSGNYFKIIISLLFSPLLHAIAGMAAGLLNSRECSIMIHEKNALGQAVCCCSIESSMSSSSSSSSCCSPFPGTPFPQRSRPGRLWACTMAITQSWHSRGITSPPRRFYSPSCP